MAVPFPPKNDPFLPGLTPGPGGTREAGGWPWVGRAPGDDVPMGWRPPVLTSAPDVFSLLRALRRRWVLALTLGLVLAAVAAPVIWFSVPPSRYVARAMLHVSATPPNIIFETREARGNFDIYKQTQLRLLKSRAVFSSLLKKPEVRTLRLVQEASRVGDPVAWLEKEVQAEYTGELLNISMSGTRPQDLATLVNAVADSYLNEVVNVEANDRKKRHSRLKNIYESYQAKLQEKRAALEAVAKQVGSADQSNVRFSHALALETRALMERELLRLRTDLRKAETELTVRRGSLESAPLASRLPENEIAAKVDADEQITLYKGRVRKLENTLAAVRSRVRTPSDPSVQRPTQELNELNAFLARRRAELRPKVVQKMLADLAIDADVVELEKQVQVLKQLEGLTEADVKGLTANASSINENSINLEGLQNDILIIDTAAKRVGNEVEALNVELDADSRVRMIEPATTPSLTADLRPKMVGQAALVAFAVACVGVSLIEFRARRVATTEDLIQGLGIRLVGTMPLSRVSRGGPPAGGGPRGRSRHDPLVESVDSMRTNILSASSAQPIGSVMVTSAVGGEGKTTLACHLATSISRAGRRTLLIDGDLRRPDVHRLFDLPPGPGFCELLRGEADAEVLVRPSFVHDLWVLTAGKIDDHALQELAQDNLRDIIHRFKNRFDFIVFDSSPVLPVADALLIGRHVDAVIYSVLRGVSQLPKVYAAHERVHSLGIRSMGAVVSGVVCESYGKVEGYGEGARRHKDRVG